MGEIYEILRRYGIRADKSLSQNFLTDSFVVKKIADGAEIDDNSAVIEIGGGVGSLTKELLARAGHVTVIELDKRLCDVLLSEYQSQKLDIINADILKTDLNPIISKLLKDWPDVKICANLPYHITTPVIMKLLEETAGVSTFVLMMQKEVADRITASPGTRSYGAITPAIYYRADVKLLANVPPNCFIPRPSVYSAVLRFNVLEQKRVAPLNEELMFDIIKASFGQRRKTIFNAISNQLLPKIGLTKNELHKCFFNEPAASFGITPSIRGEALDLFAFAALSDTIFAQSKLLNR